MTPSVFCALFILDFFICFSDREVMVLANLFCVLLFGVPVAVVFFLAGQPMDQVLGAIVAQIAATILGIIAAEIPELGWVGAVVCLIALFAKCG